jgi:type I restriction enzyme S subunit
MKLTAYRNYKTTEAPWLGDVPSHWEVRRLRTVLRLRNEKNSPVKTEQILSLSIARGVTLYSHEGRGGNKRKEDITAYKIAHAGDIVLNSMNVIVGAVGLSRYTGAISPVYYALFPATDEVDIKYYDKVFGNTAFQRYLLIYGKGILIKKSNTGKLNTIRMKISPDDLKGTLLPIPPKDEQTQIARFLEWKTAQINKFIRNKRRLIELLREQKQAIINQAVTRGLDPNVKFKPSGVAWIGDIPEHWEVAPLKHLASINARVLPESTDQNYTFKYFDISSVGTGCLSGEPETLRFGQAPSRARRILKKGDTILSTVRTYLKAVYYVSDEVENWIASTGFAALTPKKAIHPPFLGLVIQSDNFINRVIRESIGVAYPAIAETKLGTLHLAYPKSIEEQQTILEHIADSSKAIDQAIIRAQREIELMREYRTRLIADVVTGQVDVRGIEVPAVADDELLALDEDTVEAEDVIDDEVEMDETD